jgi:diguanylate cyclase (GGDEF)-like protein
VHILLEKLMVEPSDSCRIADNPIKPMWTDLIDMIEKYARRLWRTAMRGHVFNLELAKTIGFASLMLVGISLAEDWFAGMVFENVGFVYLYFLPIWFSARKGGRLAGGLISVMTATKWAMFADARYPFLAWMLNVVILAGVMMIFETLERRMARVSKEAATDPLTGLLNRAAFVNRGKEILHETENTRSQCAVVLLDCNKFKSINDQYGHAAGDEALKVLARALKDSSQGDDLIARLGGDEFVVLLAETDSIGANLFMNRLNGTLRRASAELAFELSASAGIAYYGYDGRSLDILMQVADEKMYRNKQRSNLALATVAESGVSNII